MPARENREPGENPGRTRHCNGESLTEPPLSRLGRRKRSEPKPGDLPVRTYCLLGVKQALLGMKAKFSAFKLGTFYFALKGDVV